MGYISRLEVQVFTDCYQVRQRLAIAHNLRKDKKKKPVLHAEDEFELLKTLYTSTETTFPHERYRIQLALIMQLAGITGNRPSALLAVRYQHIKVTLLEDPNGGEQPRVLIEIVFNHTKGYLGEKDAYVFKFHTTFAVTSNVSRSLISVAETSLEYLTSPTSHACCFALTSQCSLCFLRIKPSPPPP